MTHYNQRATHHCPVLIFIISAVEQMAQCWAPLHKLLALILSLFLIFLFILLYFCFFIKELK